MDSKKWREAKTCQRGGGREAGRGARAMLWKGRSRLCLPSVFSSQARLLQELQRPQEWVTSPCIPTAHCPHQALCQAESQTSPPGALRPGWPSLPHSPIIRPLDAGPPPCVALRLFCSCVFLFSPSSYPPPTHSTSPPPLLFLLTLTPASMVSTGTSAHPLPLPGPHPGSRVPSCRWMTNCHRPDTTPQTILTFPGFHSPVALQVPCLCPCHPHSLGHKVNTPPI